MCQMCCLWGKAEGSSLEKSQGATVGLELGADTADSRTGHTGKGLELADAAC